MEDSNKIIELSKLSLDAFAYIFKGMYLLESNVKARLFQTIKDNLGEDWFTMRIESKESGSVFEEEVQFILRRKRKNFKLRDDGLLVESGLGFWVEFFNKQLYRQTKGTPIMIFLALPKDVKRKDIYEKLYKLKEFRNKLYHARIPIITTNADRKHLNKLVEQHDLLLQMLTWLDVPFEMHLDQIAFTKTIDRMKIVF